jgi:hypothetical protein
MRGARQAIASTLAAIISATAAIASLRPHDHPIAP